VTSPPGAPGRLLVVATPIGNLEDLSPRALTALREATLVLCEDTRRTGNLFARHGLTTPRVSCHEHNEFRRIPEVLERLAAGETLALVSDAGTPGVSDPGRLLAAAAAAAGYRVEPVAGPSAVAAVLSISGFPAVPYSFLGFPPSRRGERARWYARFAARDETRVLFESPFRVVESLREMAAAWGDPKVCLGRELTKLHEEVLRGSAFAVAGLLSRRPGVKGEIAIAAAPAGERAAHETPDAEDRVAPEDSEDSTNGPDPDGPDDRDGSADPDDPGSPSRE
jgi:16S rRNA (cytidine1402-2'-O)-methyltransferase